MKINKFSILLVSIATIALAGCGEGEPTESTSNSSSSTSQPVDPMDGVLQYIGGTFEGRRGYFVKLLDKTYEGEVVIPDYYQDLPVYSVDAGGFYESSITKVTLPKHLLFVEKNAFYGCSKLKEVVFNDELKVIGNEAFGSCESLEAVSFPDSLIEISSYAFILDKKLSITHWPNKLQVIGDSAFSYCESIGDVSLGASIKKIDYAFYKSNITSFTLANGHQVKNLEFCFFECRYLTNVSLGSGVESITDFSDCDSLKTIVLPEGVKVLKGSFNGTTNLESITIPSSIERIEDCFKNCSSLQYTSYGDCYYLGNPSNPHLVLASAIKSNPDEGYDDVLTSVTAHNDCRIILQSAFKNCKELYQVNLGDNIIRIEDYAFLNCYSLVHINLPDSILEMGYGIFTNCYSLREITLPYYLTEIKDSTFSRCFALQSVNFGSRLKTIGQSVFCGCIHLNSIDLKNVTTIKYGAFLECANLFEVKSASLPLVIGDETSYGGVAHYAKQILRGSEESKISTDVTGMYHYYTDTSDKYFLKYTGGASTITVPATVNILTPCCFYNYGSVVTTINIGTNVTKFSFYCFVTYLKSLTTINYTGTKAQWNVISWESADYYEETFLEMRRIPSGVTIHCSDGDIIK